MKIHPVGAMPDMTKLQVAFYIYLNMPKNSCRGRTNTVFWSEFVN